MPARKNKFNADIENREKKASVVQRFVSETEPEIQTEPVAEVAEEIPAKEKPQKPQEPQIVFKLKNTMEETVVTEVTAALKHMSGICKCEKCFWDICAVVLNTIPQHYATTEQGDLMGKARALLNFEMRGKISGEVFKAIELVKQNPTHK